jgi:hypothetical protein
MVRLITGEQECNNQSLTNLRELWPDKRTAGSPGPCGWSSWFFLSARLTATEVDVFEAWFGDILDELFETS